LIPRKIKKYSDRQKVYRYILFTEGEIYEKIEKSII